MLQFWVRGKGCWDMFWAIQGKQTIKKQDLTPSPLAYFVPLA